MLRLIVGYRNTRVTDVFAGMQHEGFPLTHNVPQFYA